MIPWNEKHLNQFIHTNWQIMTRELCTDLSALMHLEQWWQFRNIPELVPGGFHKCSHRNRRADGNSFLDHFVTSDKTSVTTSWSQNGGLRTGDTWSPPQRKSLRHFNCIFYISLHNWIFHYIIYFIILSSYRSVNLSCLNWILRIQAAFQNPWDHIEL